LRPSFLRFAKVLSILLKGGLSLAKILASNQDGWAKSYASGRAAVGIITGLGPAAIIGDITRKVESGDDYIQALINGSIFGK
jgi:type II secretory pathway component PulF